jgi:hypothetical protein
MRKIRVQIAAMFLLGMASLGMFIWAADKNYEIGTRASDTNTTGGGDQLALALLAVSFAVLLVVVIGLLVMLTRRLERGRLRAMHPNISHSDNAAKVLPR